MTAAAFRHATGVSRETLARLVRYAELLQKWQGAVNLVGPGTIPDMWRRHMLDSAQLVGHAEDLMGAGQCWLDMGSGAGFPGLVLAILGVGQVHLVESDQRKCTFLREVARETGARVTIHRARLEDLAPFPAAVVTARALAPLSRLLLLGEKFLTQDSVCLFLKGQDVDNELTQAGKDWKMTVDRFPSRSDPSGTVLRIGGLTHV